MEIPKVRYHTQVLFREIKCTSPIEFERPRDVHNATDFDVRLGSKSNVAEHNALSSTPTRPTKRATCIATHHDGCIESLLTAKLTNRLKSENLDAASAFVGVSVPEGVLDGGGEASAARIPSPPVPDSRLTRLPPGLPSWDCCPGSMSSDDKNEVLSSSGFVLVMVRNVSIRSFCCAFGVPFRSMI